MPVFFSHSKTEKLPYQMRKIDDLSTHFVVPPAALFLVALVMNIFLFLKNLSTGSFVRIPFSLFFFLGCVKNCIRTVLGRFKQKKEKYISVINYQLKYFEVQYSYFFSEEYFL